MMTPLALNLLAQLDHLRELQERNIQGTFDELEDKSDDQARQFSLSSKTLDAIFPSFHKDR